mmetsp:Transcript_395/g.587  ORF Transcript_395/g.587 Transcript_395/m.587 type:complete len:151 (+) Transcript_395:32-484(+)
MLFVLKSVFFLLCCFVVFLNGEHRHDTRPKFLQTNSLRTDEGDSFFLESITQVGNRIDFIVKYWGSGDVIHVFTFELSTWARSSPTQRSAVLHHQANNDPQERELTQTITFEMNYVLTEPTILNFNEGMSNCYTFGWDIAVGSGRCLSPK